MDVLTSGDRQEVPPGPPEGGSCSRYHSSLSMVGPGARFPGPVDARRALTVAGMRHVLRLSPALDPGSPPRPRPGGRFPFATRAVDALAVLVAAFTTGIAGDGLVLLPQFDFWPLNAVFVSLGLTWLSPHEWTGAVILCGALWWRRRWPTAVAIGLLLAGLLYPLLLPSLIAVFTVAVHRPTRTTAWVAGLALVPFLLHCAYFVSMWLSYPAFTAEKMLAGVLGVALVAAAVGWGLFVRALHERVDRAETEAARRTEEAQRAAREEIAREMHDVLGHRLSLLSLHAGALEFSPGAPEAEIAHTAAVIRESAHRALQELRTVIGVLRAPTVEETGGTRPQAGLGDLEQLFAESREAGTDIRARLDVTASEQVAALTGRTVHRIVQEGLTNARKHAPGAEVRVEVTGGPSEGVSVELSNPVPPDASRTPVPGGGLGLIGLSERAELAGGRLTYGRGEGGYHLRAWLPWAA